MRLGLVLLAALVVGVATGDASRTPAATPAPVSGGKGGKRDGKGGPPATGKHLHVPERKGGMRFAEVGAELVSGASAQAQTEAERRRRRRSHMHGMHKNQLGKLRLGGKTDSRDTKQQQQGSSTLGTRSAKGGSSSSASKSGSGQKSGMMSGGFGLSMMSGGGYGMMGMGGMGGMGMNGPGAPVDFPPHGVGRAPMGYGQFVPFGKAIPKQPGIKYYTASGMQECAVCKQIVHAAARWGQGFYELCHMWMEQKDMCHAQQKVLQGCPEFTNGWCYQDLGGSQVLRSPCPAHLICHYCLGMNPLHCVTREVIDISLETEQHT